VLKTYTHEKSFFDQAFKDLGASCPKDPLTEPYFERLQHYATVLAIVNAISESAQEKRVATGSCVIRWTTELLNLTQASDNDSTTQRAFKEALHTAFENRIAKYITTVTNMLKASLFDTRESGKLESYGVKPNLILDGMENNSR